MVKQVLKSAQFTWRRVRKSLKSKRDAGLFEFFKSELEHLRLEAEQGQVRLWFYDESGFNLNPNAVYAWLPPQNQAKDVFLPAQRGGIMTVAGFLSTDNTLEAYSQKGAMDSAAFIAYVDDFITQQIKDTSIRHIVVIDNASFHTSAIVKRKMEAWKQQNLFFQFLPPYCSELNRIEILWRRIKHNWLQITDYASADNLENAVVNIIKLYNTKYSISFC
jgi:transposase